MSLSAPTGATASGILNATANRNATTSSLRGASRARQIAGRMARYAAAAAVRQAKNRGDPSGVRETTSVTVAER
jgi:hypothetical protein